MESKAKTKVIFHDGLTVIGGTLIEVVYGKSRIFFDFGMTFDPALDEGEERFDVLLRRGSINDIPNLYDPRIYKNKKGIRKDEGDFETGVFISHVHLDHSKLINFIDPEIPVYMSKDSKALIESLNIKNDFILPLEKSQKSEKKNIRDIKGLDYGQSINIGDIKIKILRVDHDAYGASAFIINTPDIEISYTGDIRLHGYRRKDTLNFCKEAENTDLLIMEGVSVSNHEVGEPEEEKYKTNEEEVLKKFVEILKNNKNKQITFNYYIANIERIKNLVEVVKDYREIVLEAYHAKVLKDMTGIETKYYKLDDIDYGLDETKRVDYNELLEDEKRYLWQLETDALRYISKLKPYGIFIHSDGPPLGAYDPEYEKFLEELDKACVEFLEARCSGHAYTTDLIKIISKIKPKILAPIHSFNPQRLFNIYGERILPERGEEFIF